MSDSHPVLTSSAPNLNTAELIDGNWNHGIEVPYAEEGKQTFIRLEFAAPFRSQALTIAAGTGSTFGGSAIPDGEVQASQDGSNWITLLNLPGPAHAFSGFPARTYSFPEISARYYRVLVKRKPLDPVSIFFDEFLGYPPVPPRSFKLAEIEFHSGPRVNHWQEKAAFTNMLEYQTQATPPIRAEEAIVRKDVIDLTSKMSKDGALDWDVPPGKWLIMRFGYSLTGEKNHPATREATGFEVDKLSRKHVENYARNYVDMISSALGPYYGKSFRYFVMDSWEVGMENWTERMSHGSC
jgi:hypothetical protein